MRTALGRLLSHMQQHDRALQELSRAERLFEASGSRTNLEALRVTQTKALRRAGKLPEAQSMALKAVNDAMQSDPPDADDLALALRELALVQAAAGDPETARQTLGRAYDALRDMPGDDTKARHELDRANADLGPITPRSPVAAPR